MKNASEFWNKKAEKYAKMPIPDKKAYEALLDGTRSYLSKDHRVLEIGCGTGSTALLLAKQVKDYLAMDFSEAMIDIANCKLADENIDQLRFKTANIEKILSEGQCFDVVLAFNLLHLLHELDKDLQHIASMVKPGGLFISKTFCTLGPNSSWKLHLFKFALPLLGLLGLVPAVRFMEPELLQKKLTEHGFEVIETKYFSDSVTSPFIVAQKSGS